MDDGDNERVDISHYTSPLTTLNAYKPPGKFTLQKHEFITELNANDVLFGRGNGAAQFEGNIRFRNHLSPWKDEYISCSRKRKSQLAREVVDWVLKNNGRFVRKLEIDEAYQVGLISETEYKKYISDKADPMNERMVGNLLPSFYELVDDRSIIDKAKQALRQIERKNADEVDIFTETHNVSVPESATATSLVIQHENTKINSGSQDTLRRVSGNEILQTSSNHAIHDQVSRRSHVTISTTSTNPSYDGLTAIDDDLITNFPFVGGQDFVRSSITSHVRSSITSHGNSSLMSSYGTARQNDLPNVQYSRNSLEDGNILSSQINSISSQSGQVLSAAIGNSVNQDRNFNDSTNHFQLLTNTANQVEQLQTSPLNHSSMQELKSPDVVLNQRIMSVRQDLNDQIERIQQTKSVLERTAMSSQALQDNLERLLHESRVHPSVSSNGHAINFDSKISAGNSEIQEYQKKSNSLNSSGYSVNSKSIPGGSTAIAQARTYQSLQHPYFSNNLPPLHESILDISNNASAISENAKNDSFGKPYSREGMNSSTQYSFQDRSSLSQETLLGRDLIHILTNQHIPYIRHNSIPEHEQGIQSEDIMPHFHDSQSLDALDLQPIHSQKPTLLHGNLQNSSNEGLMPFQGPENSTIGSPTKWKSAVLPPVPEQNDKDLAQEDAIADSKLRAISSNAIMNRRGSAASGSRSSYASRRSSKAHRRDSISAQSMTIDDLTLDSRRRISSLGFYNSSMCMVDDFLDSFSTMNTEETNGRNQGEGFDPRQRRSSQKTSSTVETIEQLDGICEGSFATIESNIFSIRSGDSFGDTGTKKTN